jgi:hypothetical protein
MSQSSATIFKIPTESPQVAPARAAKLSGRPKRAPHGPGLVSSNGRAATRGGGEVIELKCGITVAASPG